MKVIGYIRKNFTTQDGKTICGYNVYLSRMAVGIDAAGCTADRVYLSDARLAESGYTLAVGDEVELSYNRYGKVQHIFKIGD